MYVGIDYSLRSPAICICESDIFDLEYCKFHFLSDVRRNQDKFQYNITGHPYPSYKTDEERYDKISDWVLNLIGQPKYVCIEGYAFSATGQVFNIGENTGLLKYKLFKQSTPFLIVPPTQVKKLACGKGNGNKQQVYDGFVTQTGADIKSIISPKTKDVGNPVSDIVDAFYICKFMMEKIRVK